MVKTILLGILAMICIGSSAQAPAPSLRIKVLATDSTALPGSTVQLLSEESTVLQKAGTDSSGIAIFRNLLPGKYKVEVTRVTHQASSLDNIVISDNSIRDAVVLLVPQAGVMGNVTVTAKKPMVQFLPDKTVVNVDASIGNAGTTVMEVLERSPGVTTDRDGNITLKGKPGILILIDGKPTQLAGMDLQNLLTGMSSSQVETIELIDNPSSKYDAAGNGGIINIRTKKTKQRGFNGNLSAAFGYGKLPKNNNSLTMNLREGRFNFFVTYSSNLSKQLMDLYALRTYYDANRSVLSMLEQPYYTRTRGVTHLLNAGFDYYVSSKTTIGIAFNGLYLTRRKNGEAEARWMDANTTIDSIVYTNSINNSRLKRGGVAANVRHVINKSQEISFDVDYMRYDITNTQLFENRPNDPNGNFSDASRGDIPSSLNIYSAKIDYTKRFNNLIWESGWKSSRVETDNLAEYDQNLGSNWQEDLGKSNHFLYTENIHALYTNAQWEKGKWSLQGGLRYEHTGYDARQLGNAQVKDSSFNRSYGNLFPSMFATYRPDSINSITLRAGRRIDRPAFQKLNPFTFIINKYTYQQGNPYFKPQFTWNFEISHQYKDFLSTTLSYNIIKDYISQVFYEDPNSELIVYTEGNIGEMHNLGLTVSTQLNPAKWWSFNFQATGNYKTIEAMLWKLYRADIWQANMSMNHQFRFNKGWGAELSGMYITRAQNDIQEVLRPNGHLSIGVSKQVLKKAGMLRLTFRDMFYTLNMSGFTDFQFVDETFKLQQDSRVVTLAFSWRFGKAMKQVARRNTGASGEILERVGTN